MGAALHYNASGAAWAVSLCGRRDMPTTSLQNAVTCRQCRAALDVPPSAPRKNPHAVALGKLGGSVTSEAKAAAARANGALGGRPPASPYVYGAATRLSNAYTAGFDGRPMPPWTGGPRTLAGRAWRAGRRDGAARRSRSPR